MRNIPVLMVKGRSLAEAWEKSLIVLYEQGSRVKTEYDKPDDPLSVDATMSVVIEEPSSEPRIHRCFPGSLEFLEEYRLEVVEGIKDHWIRDPDNPEDTRWEYTYHERLFTYSYFTRDAQESHINQIEHIAQKLASSPYSRRAQAITWKVWEDIQIDSPPCLQSIWCRVLSDEKGRWWLNMNVRMRSNDAYEAAFMNMFAFVSLQEYIASRIGEIAGKDVRLGRYVHFADSYHIYGKRLEDFEQRFLRAVRERSFEERTWNMEFAEAYFTSARPQILEKVKRETKKFTRSE
ncbi:hypothetical protein J7M23_04055 [Candidatus Sumerlaeota bacterium]|nr:hypothetical protein [Candidatus Sumerlaeota bacterium]